MRHRNSQNQQTRNRKPFGMYVSSFSSLGNLPRYSEDEQDEWPVGQPEAITPGAIWY